MTGKTQNPLINTYFATSFAREALLKRRYRYEGYAAVSSDKYAGNAQLALIRE
jgi:hypothetical protein